MGRTARQLINRSMLSATERTPTLRELLPLADFGNPDNGAVVVLWPLCGPEVVKKTPLAAYLDPGAPAQHWVRRRSAGMRFQRSPQGHAPSNTSA